MSRSIRTRRNRTVNTQEQEAGQANGFFQKKQDPSFFNADQSIQRLSTPEDEKEPATNDSRMKLDKDIQRCPCEDTDNTAPAEVTAQIEDKAGKGQGLPQQVQQQMGQAIGADFSDVNVHTDDQAAKMSKDLGAQAFTHGSDIYFNKGKYDPSSTAGKHLLAHELTHVVQQGKAPAVNKKIQRNIVPLVVKEPRRVGSGSVKMGPGIAVSWNGDSMSITGHLEISGEAATPAIAAQIQSTINSYWNQSFPDGYNVSCSVDVTYRAPDAAEDSSRTQIDVVNGSGFSYVTNRWLVGARYMSLNVAEADLNWTPAHEFGHLIGIPDHYSEGVFSKVSGFFGGEREVTQDAGWEGNIMTETGGKVESKNVQEWLKLHGVKFVMPGTAPDPATPTEA